MIDDLPTLERPTKLILGAGGLGNLRNLAIAGDELGKLVVNGIGHGHSLVVGSYKRAR